MCVGVGVPSLRSQPGFMAATFVCTQLSPLVALGVSCQKLCHLLSGMITIDCCILLTIADNPPSMASDVALVVGLGLQSQRTIPPRLLSMLSTSHQTLAAIAHLEASDPPTPIEGVMGSCPLVENLSFELEYGNGTCPSTTNKHSPATHSTWC